MFLLYVYKDEEEEEDERFLFLGGWSFVVARRIPICSIDCSHTNTPV